ncbi:hypothetical protein P171DRAFT_445259 [Karstenula rhodostoma CBS 690.94]|uniref:Ig-like domain-containing protein n=1 Tax=Karstenula rhodostoma CBS 690.94 TaxID=1392251 RepID=A0A9P4UA38_9PLEO|nr:hypothetical protein P171DRAFT_445259 [Karstenula rhodostoma CBS 690.94]
MHMLAGVLSSTTLTLGQRQCDDHRDVSSAERQPEATAIKSRLDASIFLREAADPSTILACPVSAPLTRTSRSWFVAGSDRESAFVNADYSDTLASSSYECFTEHVVSPTSHNNTHRMSATTDERDRLTSSNTRF